MKKLIIILLSILFLACESDQYNNHHCGYIEKITLYPDGMIGLYINWASGKGWTYVYSGTYIKAIRPSDSELIEYCGPDVPGITLADAQNYCENNGLGYCRVHGILVAEVGCKPGTFEADWDTYIDYENPSLN